MRHAWLLIGLLAVLGCQKNQMNFDPFSMSGPTLMPPPGTGSAGRPDPYYRPSSPNPGSLGANGLPAQYARFTSVDGGGVTEVADQRASYTPPPTGAAPAGTSVAPSWSGGQPAMPYSGGSAYTPPNSAPALPPAAMNPNAFQQANPLAPGSPAGTPPANWSGRY